MNSNKKIMILGASELQVPAIECCKKLGFESLAVDYDPNAAGFEIADKVYVVSTLDYEKVLEVATEEKIDGILTICSDRPMTVVARVGEKLGLNTISYDTSIKATNKAKMRMALKENNVPIPEFAVCTSKTEFEQNIMKFDYPFIVKPSDNSGSRGITLVNNHKDAEFAYEYARENTLDGVVLVEEYMVGPEVSVEIFVYEGEPKVIQVTDKITTGAPHFVEMGHTQPSALPDEMLKDIKNVAVAATKALGIDKGPAHVEIKVTDKGAKIVELGARLGGDYIATDLVPLSTGYDMVRATVLCAANEPLPDYINEHNCSAIRYFSYEHSINLTSKVITKLERIFINRIENKEILSSRDREGFFIVRATDFDSLYQSIEEVTKKIH